MPRSLAAVRPAGSAGRVLLYLALSAAAVFFLVPLFVMVITSVKSMADIRSGHLISWPREFTLEAWRKAWDSACIGVNCVGLKGYFWNSVRMVVPAVVLSTLIGAMNGYVFSKWRFPGSETFFSFLLLGCFIPFQVILLPMSLTLGWLGIAQSVQGLILVHTVYGLPFTTLFFRNFYVTIPDAQDRAACLRADLRVLHHLADHPDLERLPVRRGLLGKRQPAGDGGPEQPGEHQHGGEGVQRGHGGGDHRRPADAAGVHRLGQVLRARPHGRGGERMRATWLR